MEIQQIAIKKMLDLENLSVRPFSSRPWTPKVRADLRGVPKHGKAANLSMRCSSVSFGHGQFTRPVGLGKRRQQWGQRQCSSTPDQIQRRDQSTDCADYTE